MTSGDIELVGGPGAVAPLPEVAEFQGLYGTYHVSELLLQKIWLRGGFDAKRARTTHGEPVVVLHPGSWNRLSGPDFRGARLRIADREVTGDIEVHFHAAAWAQHGHDRDRAYDGVVLHVVLFPSSQTTPPTRTSDGREIPVLVLVDLLWHDLEEYATDEAVAALSSRDALPLVEDLLALEPAARAAAIHAAAQTRWQEKVRYAKLRIDRCGWEEACHLTALEILGYRANREAMLRVGTRFPASRWRSPEHPTGPETEALLAAGGESWTLRGVRPANQPRLRLEQYRRWMARVPDWPARLVEFCLPTLDDAAPEGTSITMWRRRVGLTRLREQLARELAGEQLGGVRLDTWIVNLVLPFYAAAHAQLPEGVRVAAAWWRLWTPGDIAEVLLEAARRLAPPGSREPRSNEAIQGLLGIHLRRISAAGTPG